MCDCLVERNDATAVAAASVASVDVQPQEETASTTSKPDGILKKEVTVLSEILNFLNDANNP